MPLPVNSPPADLVQPCPELQKLSGKTGKDVTLWMINAAHRYNDCKARHAALVEAITTP